MIKPAAFAAAVAFSVTAFAQPGAPKPPQRPVMSSASAAPSTKEPCDLMSPEEMHECLVTKPHAAERSVYCDQVSRRHIESCLRKHESAATGASNETKDKSAANTGR
jgi:hypothetical protein